MKNKAGSADGLKRIYKSETVMLGVAMLAVFIISVWYVGENYSLKVWGDEFGYWQSAAYLTGKDWSSVASTNSYYGFGFGILLVPFMLLLGDNPMLMMQAALVLEAFMLTSCVAAAYLCIGYFSDRIKGLFRVLLAVLPVLYPSNVLFVNTTMAEILLVTLVWWYTYMALRFIERQGLGAGLALMGLSIYMYAVHQRTIGIWVISLMLVVWVCRKKIFNAKFLLIVGVLAFGLILVLVFKNVYTDAVYSEVSEARYVGNNLSGQTSKITRILTSSEGFGNFILSLVGKYYYVAVSSYMLVVLGILYCSQVIIQCIRDKGDWNKMAGVLVIGLNFLAAYVISAIFMSEGAGERTDVLIYGRYTEYVIGPLVILGIVYLYECSNFKTVLAALGVTGLTAVIADNAIGYKATNSNMWCSCSAIADLLKYSHYLNGEILYKAFLRGCIALFLLLLALSLRKYIKDIAFLGVVFCICVAWVTTGYKVRNEKVIPWADKLYLEQAEVLAYIDEPQFGLYHSHIGGFFQFLRVDAKVQHFETLEEISDAGQALYIITYTQAEDVQQIWERQEIVFENDTYVLWRANIR